MSESAELALREAMDELRSFYDRLDEGILVADAGTRRLFRANRAVCELLGYSEKELLSLSLSDIHPAESLPEVLEAFEAASRRHLKYARNIRCLRKDGSIVCVDMAANYICWQTQPLLVGFFRDITQQNRTIEMLRASEDRYRLIADNVADVIWTAPLTLSESEKAAARVNLAEVVDAVLDRWQFSFISPAAERLFGFTPDEIARLSIRHIATPASYARIREAMLDEFMEPSRTAEDGAQPHMLELELLTKDGSPFWCEIVSTYLRDNAGLPTGILGITRDISDRRKAEHALRESESKLRSLFENLPDLVILVDQNGRIQFVNRAAPGLKREQMVGASGFGFLAPEHQEACRLALGQAFATGLPQAVEALDVFGHWWTCRVVSLAKEGEADHAMVICTDITQERLATEAVDKEKRLLRQLLELHERERRLMAYEIHDGFAQQLTGALFRLQGFRDMHANSPAKAWENFDSAVQLVSHAIDETRRLISGLRPPILDESGIVPAIEYLIYEHRKQDGPNLEFVHDVAFERLAPPMESAVFRIVQESLQNACRHSRGDKVRVELTQRGNRIHVVVRDWGVGFSPETVEERRFGLQGIRERVRLLDGCVVIDSSPGKGTCIAVELPLVDNAADAPEGVGMERGDP